MRLKDKVAIVTGAASGLGASTAMVFAKEGADGCLDRYNGIRRRSNGFQNN